MGFWHTGYFEFHEETGLEDYKIKEAEPIYRCLICSKEFKSPDDMRKHRFEEHPHRRPFFMLRGIELGATEFHITRYVDSQEFVIKNVTEAIFNGNHINPEIIPLQLSRITDDTVNITLINEEIRSDFKLNIRIADEKDLYAVESKFFELARIGLLNTNSINTFICNCKLYKTAVPYYDGICHYLYGVLAKERSPDSCLKYDEYRDRFNCAVDALRDYNRPLAYIIRGLVAFHFNQFADAKIYSPHGRLRAVASLFAEVLEKSKWEYKIQGISNNLNILEDMLTDYETLCIIRWAETPREQLINKIKGIEDFSKKNMPELDRIKIGILLAEAYATSGNIFHARTKARELIGNSITEKWAKKLLEMLLKKETIK